MFCCTSILFAADTWLILFKFLYFNLTGAFEVKVPLKMKSDVIRSESKAKSTDESLKISKMSQKPTPITVSNTSENNHEESFDNQAEGTNCM